MSNSLLRNTTFVAIVVLSLWWFLHESSPTPGTDAATSAQKEPDLFATEINFEQLNLDGTLHYRLAANTISQFDDDAITFMTVPKFHLTSAPPAAPWDIQAQLGRLTQQLGEQGSIEDVLYLNDRVELRQIHPVNGLVIVEATSFQVFPDRQFAQTDENVIIITEVGRTQAGGLRADLATGHLQLSSNETQRVHTIVLPEQFKKPTATGNISDQHAPKISS